MNTLEKLIAKLCPDGVEYKPLGNYCSYVRGVTYSKDQETSSQINSIGLLRANNIELKSCRLLLEDVKRIKSTVKVNPTQWLKKGDILICAGSGSREHIGKVAFIECDMDYVFGGFMAVVRCKEKLDSRFLFHLLRSVMFKNHLALVLNSSTINNLKSEYVSSFVIPIPPLPVQKEIVRMLDDMAGLIDALEEELAARKKQYEWYRDRLLTFDEVVEKKALGEIATDFSRGNGILRTQVTATGAQCVRYGEIYTSYDIWFAECLSHTKPEFVVSPRYFECGDILFAITGEKIDEIGKAVAYVGHDKCIAGGDIAVMKHKQNAKYLAYALSTPDAQNQKSHGKVKSKVVHLSVPQLKAVKIPIPSLRVQENIVKKLDGMTALIDGIEEEIALRKQQYEYYRDKLLTFKRKAEVA